MIDHDDDNGDDGVANFYANAKQTDQRSDADSKTLAPRVFYQET